MGDKAQLAVWDAYFRNIYDHYRGAYGAQLRELTGHGRRLGFVPNPWGPPNQHVPRPPSWNGPAVAPSSPGMGEAWNWSNNGNRRGRL
jgi:hypothetical protein